MGTLVVQAHPLDESYNAAVLGCVCAGLESTGVDFGVARLGEGDRPTAAELAAAQRLVLVYPTWWGGQPAMLLAWLQQMLREQAFGSVARLQAATTHGSSRLINTVQGEWGRRFLSQRVAKACRPGTKLEWQALYKIDRRTPDEIQGFLKSTEAVFSA